MQNKPFGIKFLCLLTSLLLSACATIVPPQQGPLTSSSWVMRGRVAIQTPQHSGNASLYWQQQGKNYQVHLFGPLGLGAIVISKTPQQVVLITANGHHYSAATPEQLLKTIVGWQMPVSDLTYWLRGLPAPRKISSFQRDAQGRLRQLEQDGWQITYVNYFSPPNRLPHLLICQRPQFILRIVVDQWENS